MTEKATSRRLGPAAMSLLLALGVTLSVSVAPASGVVGGTLVAEESAPWFASWWNCGGTLVAPDRVLTAGQCLRGRPLSDIESIQIGGTFRRGIRFALHPDWRRRNGRNQLEDVALIKLDKPVTGVPPVTIGGPVPERVKILGRGAFTAPAGAGGLGQSDDQLRGAELRLLTDARCARAYRDRRGFSGERFHPSQMLCTTDIDGLEPLSSACSGDAGGPIYSGPEAAPTLHGIVSWGTARCGADLLPNVHASVKRARRFITARAPTWAPVPNGPVYLVKPARVGWTLWCYLPAHWIVRPTRVRVQWHGWRQGPATVGYGREYLVRRRDAGHRVGCSAKASNAGGSTAVDGASLFVPRQ
jgi:Trypsin